MALAPLPKEAIWACLDRSVQQGKLSVKALRAVSGKIDTRLAIFVEDEFAKHWVEAILRTELPEAHGQVEVHEVAGDGVAVSIHRSHLNNPAIRFKSLCVIDGDSEQNDDPASGIYRLPGRQPELTVFDAVAAGMDRNIGMVQKRRFSGNTRNLSADPDQSRVGAGLRESLAAMLGLQFRENRVYPRSSSQ